MFDEPIIEITAPELMFPDEVDFLEEKDMSVIRQYNYDNCHIIFKGKDLGSLTELAKLRKEHDELKDQNKMLDARNNVYEERFLKALDIIEKHEIFDREELKTVLKGWEND